MAGTPAETPTRTDDSPHWVIDPGDDPFWEPDSDEEPGIFALSTFTRTVPPVSPKKRGPTKKRGTMRTCLVGNGPRTALVWDRRPFLGSRAPPKKK